MRAVVAALLLSSASGCVLISDEDREAWEASFGEACSLDINASSVALTPSSSTDGLESSSLVFTLETTAFPTRGECGHYQLFRQSLDGDAEEPVFYSYGVGGGELIVGGMRPGGSYQVIAALAEGPFEAPLGEEALEALPEKRRATLEVTVAEGAPYLAIAAPKTGTSIGTPFTLEFTIENFELYDPADTGEVPDEAAGHWHVYVDLEGSPATADDAAAYIPGSSRSLEFADYEPGEHRFLVRLQEPDHDIYQPVVADEVILTVQ
jgi:hypothetical protein